jgi:hypothetical protein
MPYRDGLFLILRTEGHFLVNLTKLEGVKAKLGHFCDRFKACFVTGILHNN